MKRTLLAVSLPLVALLVAAAVVRAYPKPSLYPKSWELKFVHAQPTRIVVTPPGSSVPQAYWYMTFVVTNETKEEREFLPVFDMLTADGKVARSNQDVPPAVFDAVKAAEKAKLLEPLAKITGRLLPGEDEAKESAAIWPETNADMSTFTVFVAGLSGEAELYRKEGDEYIKVEDKDLATVDRSKLLLMKKTLKMDYKLLGDKERRGVNTLEPAGEESIMREVAAP